MNKKFPLNWLPSLSLPRAKTRTRMNGNFPYAALMRCISDCVWWSARWVKIFHSFSLHMSNIWRRRWWWSDIWDLFIIAIEVFIAKKKEKAIRGWDEVFQCFTTLNFTRKFTASQPLKGQFDFDFPLSKQTFLFSFFLASYFPWCRQYFINKYLDKKKDMTKGPKSAMNLRCTKDAFYVVQQ